MGTEMIKARLVCAPGAVKALGEALGSRGIAISEEAGVTIAERGMRAPEGGILVSLIPHRPSRYYPFWMPSGISAARDLASSSRGRTRPFIRCMSRESSISRLTAIPSIATRTACATRRRRNCMSSNRAFKINPSFVSISRSSSTWPGYGTFSPGSGEGSSCALRGTRRNSKSRGTTSAISRPSWECSRR